MQNLGQIGPENCRAYVFFAFFPLLFGFCFLFFPFFYFFLFSPFFPFFFLVISWSKFALIFHIARFQFQKYKIFSFWESTSPSDTPCVCKYAIGTDATPTKIVRSGFTINSPLFQNDWVKIHHRKSKVRWRFTKLICFFLGQDSL